MTDKKAPRLFFVDDNCKDCPTYGYSFNSSEWFLTNSEPRIGDHVIVAEIEMVIGVNGKPRKLRDDEIELWDEISFPEKALIEELPYEISARERDCENKHHSLPFAYTLARLG